MGLFLAFTRLFLKIFDRRGVFWYEPERPEVRSGASEYVNTGIREYVAV